MFKRLAEMFAEGSGKLSGPRTIFNLLGLAFVGAWTWLSIKNGVMQDIPENLIWTLGILGGLKVAQKPFETKVNGEEKKE